MGTVARRGWLNRTTYPGGGRRSRGRGEGGVRLLDRVPGEVFAMGFGFEVAPSLGEKLEGGFDGTTSSSLKVFHVAGSEGVLEGADVAGNEVALKAKLASDGGVGLALAVSAPDAVG